MTRRERMENKIARREEWTDKAKARSAQAFTAVHRVADGIPFGQPILVGHHSERHARRDQERIRSGMDRGCEQQDLAAHHESKAIGLQHQLDRSVFSDDTDAIEKIEARIAEHETQAARMVATNKAWRAHVKGDDAPLRALGFDDTGIARLAKRVAETWDKKPVAAFEMTNLRARIRTDRLRIDEIKARQARTAKAKANGGVCIEDHGEYVAVVFAEKPDREVLDALRAAGFGWGGGRWSGKTAALPQCVKDLVGVPVEETPVEPPTPPVI